MYTLRACIYASRTNRHTHIVLTLTCFRIRTGLDYKNRRTHNLDQIRANSSRNNKFGFSAGENAVFECAVQEDASVTWLKDNKPFTDRLMDRVQIVQKSGVHRLEVLHCREDDSGLYTARAENVKGNAHCTAQLVVHECEFFFRCFRSGCFRRQFFL